MSADGRAFVDTNVLVYAHDTTAGVKREAARALLTELWDTHRGCVSVQVLQELYVSLTRKLPSPVAAREARDLVESYSTWTVHAPDAADVLAAIDLQRQARVSFWDAMMLRSASALGCATVYSEDLDPGQRYADTVVANPFA